MTGLLAKKLNLYFVTIQDQIVLDSLGIKELNPELNFY